MMKKIPTLREFLSRAGVTKDTPKHRVQSLKKQYRRVYHQLYQSKRKQDTHRFTLRFTKAEFEELKRVVVRYSPNNLQTFKKHKIAPFIKKATLAYISKQYLPRDEKLLNDLKKEIRRIGNNINQVVYRLNYQRQNQVHGRQGNSDYSSLYSNYSKLLMLISDLEARVDTVLHQPTQTLNQALMESLQDRPDKIDKLIEFLQSLKKKSDAGHKK